MIRTIPLFILLSTFTHALPPLNGSLTTLPPTASDVLTVNTVSALPVSTPSSLADGLNDNDKGRIRSGGAGGAAALSPPIQASFFSFAIFIITSLFGTRSLLPVALLATGLGAYAESTAADGNWSSMSPDADKDTSPDGISDRGIPAGPSAPTAELLTSITTISSTVSTILVSTTTTATGLSSSAPVGGEGSPGALTTLNDRLLVTSGAAPPLSPTAQSPAPFFSLVAFIATTALGPWGMLPAFLVLSALAVNGEIFEAERFGCSGNRCTDYGVPLAISASGSSKVGSGIARLASMGALGHTLLRREVLALNTSIHDFGSYRGDLHMRAFLRLVIKDMGNYCGYLGGGLWL